MTKNFILNLLLNLGIIFLLLSGIAAYQSGNMLILGLSIAVSVVIIYLKIVLLKYVRKEIVRKQHESKQQGQKKK